MMYLFDQIAWFLLAGVILGFLIAFFTHRDTAVDRARNQLAELNEEKRGLQSSLAECQECLGEGA